MAEIFEIANLALQEIDPDKKAGLLRDLEIGLSNLTSFNYNKLKKLTPELNEQEVEAALHLILEKLKSNTTVEEFIMEDRDGEEIADTIKKIGEMLVANKKIKKLSFYNCGMDKNAAGLIALALNRRDEKITHFNFVQNPIGTEGANVLVFALRGGSLKYLNFDSIDTPQKRLKLDEILKVLENSNLEELVLSCNGLEQEEARDIAEFLSRNTSLVKLIISGNDIEAKGLKIIAEGIKSNQGSSLQSLGLSLNKLGEEGAKIVADDLSHIKFIDLSHNGIGDEGVKHLLPVLGRNSQFVVIDLGSNKITSEGMELIAQELQLNKKTRGINFSANLIGDEGLKFVAEVLKVNNILVGLDFSEIGASNIGLDEIFKALGENHGITFLKFYGNEGIDEERAKEQLRDRDVLELNKNIVGIDGIFDEEVNEDDEGILDEIEDNKEKIRRIGEVFKSRQDGNLSLLTLWEMSGRISAVRDMLTLANPDDDRFVSVTRWGENKNSENFDVYFFSKYLRDKGILLPSVIVGEILEGRLAIKSHRIYGDKLQLAHSYIAAYNDKINEPEFFEHTIMPVIIEQEMWNKNSAYFTHCDQIEVEILAKGVFKFLDPEKEGNENFKTFADRVAFVKETMERHPDYQEQISPIITISQKANEDLEESVRLNKRRREEEVDSKGKEKVPNISVNPKKIEAIQFGDKGRS